MRPFGTTRPYLFGECSSTLTIVVIGTGGQLIVSSLAAYAFAKIKFKGRNLIFTLFLGSMMIPVQATIIPRFILFYEIGLYNNLWAIILPSWFGITSDNFIWVCPMT